MAFEFTDANVKEEMGKDLPMVIDFWAPWCGPCRMITPIIEELAGEYEGRVKIGKLNVDENNDTSVEYGVRNIPTILFIKNGEVVERKVGAQSKASIVEAIEKLL
ncbi:thioredoxin [Porphyromonadaceae bacterium W3.11]|nr:thioredoxin [Porphyromonadaceae bacterium W3.11]